jgi:hypothetical protein
MLLEDGKYAATVEDVYLYERGNEKRLTGAFKLDVAGKSLVHREWLEINDGTIPTYTIQRLRKCFPDWDGTIEQLAEGHCCRGVAVEVTIENEQDKKDPKKFWTRSLKINAPGDTEEPPANEPEKLDKDTLANRYASRFNAISGATAAPPLASAPPPARSAPPPAARKPAAPAAESTLNDCWAKLAKANDGKSREELEQAWFDLLESVMPGKDSGDYTPADWGAVMQSIGAPPAKTFF